MFFDFYFVHLTARDGDKGSFMYGMVVFYQYTKQERVCVFVYYVFHVAFICRRATMQHDKHLAFLGLVAQ